MDGIQSKNNTQNNGTSFSNISENNSLDKNEISIDSSNPEKIYQELTKEIYTFPENSQSNSSICSKFSNSENDEKNNIEKLLNSKYWKTEKIYSDESNEYNSDSFEKLTKCDIEIKPQLKQKKKISLKNYFFFL